MSTIHRLSAGAKLVGLFVFAVIVIAFRTPLLGQFLGQLFGHDSSAVTSIIATTLALIIAFVLASIARIPARTVLRVLRRFAIVAVLLFTFQVWQGDFVHAYAIVGGLLALIIAASVFTATTEVAEMLDTITWAIGPLRRFGVKSTLR